MIKTRLKLRGHHIATFAIDYWGYDFYESHKQDKNKTPVPLLLLERIYGRRMKNLFVGVYSLLKSQSEDIEIEIVEGLDSICKANCPQLTSECSKNKPSDEDALALKTYGLEVGRIYTARDIVQRVQDFTMRTGIRSSRDIRRSQQDADFLF